MFFLIISDSLDYYGCGDAQMLRKGGTNKMPPSAKCDHHLKACTNALLHCKKMNSELQTAGMTTIAETLPDTRQKHNTIGKMAIGVIVMVSTVEIAGILIVMAIG